MAWTPIDRKHAGWQPPDATGHEGPNMETGQQCNNEDLADGDDDCDVEDRRCLTLAFSGPAAPRYGEPARCKVNRLMENQVAAGSAATPC